MRSILKSLIRAIALRTGKLRGPYVKVCKPMGSEHTEYVRRHGGLQGMGDHCSILPSTVFTDPAYVRLGNGSSGFLVKTYRKIQRLLIAMAETLSQRHTRSANQRESRRAVHFSTCALIGHGGSIAMLNRDYDVKLDALEKIDVSDNVFIQGCFILNFDILCIYENVPFQTSNIFAFDG